jgi:hypothetical protein
VQVKVTSDGRLQLIEDTMLYPPLTVAEVEALSNAIPALQTVIDTDTLFHSLNDLAAALSTGLCIAVVEVQGTSITVTTSDPATFARFGEIFDVPTYPGSPTSFFSRGVSVTLNTGA